MIAKAENVHSSTVLPRQYHWTVDEFHKITAAGVLTESEIKHHRQGSIAPVLLPEAIIELTELF